MQIADRNTITIIGAGRAHTVLKNQYMPGQRQMEFLGAKLQGNGTGSESRTEIPSPLLVLVGHIRYYK